MDAQRAAFEHAKGQPEPAHLWVAWRTGRKNFGKWHLYRSPGTGPQRYVRTVCGIEIPERTRLTAIRPLDDELCGPCLNNGRKHGGA